MSSGGGHVLFGGELLDHLVEFGRIAQPQRVQHEVTHAAAAGEHEHAFVVTLGPASGLHVVLPLVQAGVVGHFKEHVGAHHGGHHAVRAGRGPEAQHRERRVRVHLVQRLRVRAEYLRGHVVGVLDGARVLLDAALAAVEVFLERGQVIAADAREHVGDHLDDVHRIAALFGARGRLAHFGARAHEHRGEVDAAALDLQRVFGQRFLLHRLDVVVHAVRERQDGRDADDADGARERRHERAALLRHEVLERQRERRGKRHLRATHGLVAFAQVLGGGVEGVGVASDDAVGQVHDAGGVPLGQLGVVRDHDNEAVVGDLGEQVHDLDARLGVEGAGGLVGQKDLRVVDEGAGDGHALHLAAGELAGLFVHVLAEAHALERLHGALAPLGARHTG